MERYNIENKGLEFKNLLSGPAPVGRILNYIYLAGTTGLYHKNGYRCIDLEEQIGSAWTTEFMIGLGVVAIGAEMGNKYKLVLTKRGRRLFDIISNGSINNFCEGVDANSIDLVREQINKCSKDLYTEYKDMFVNSIQFKILKDFLEENRYQYDNKVLFMDDLFEAVKDLYDNSSTPYNRNARTTTGANRVPSLLQLCKLFDMLDDSGDTLDFMKKIIEKAGPGSTSVYSEEQINEAAKNADLLVVEANDLAEKYGIDGTVLAEAVVRNSALQKMFKHNLLVSQQGKCVLCGMKNKEMLNGSHIKPSAISSASEKADFNNGLLLCCNHDRLFDRYLITFNFIDGQIEMSKTLSSEDIKLLGIDGDFKLPAELLTSERRIYLTEHNIEFRNREENR